MKVDEVAEASAVDTSPANLRLAFGVFQQEVFRKRRRYAERAFVFGEMITGAGSDRGRKVEERGALRVHRGSAACKDVVQLREAGTVRRNQVHRVPTDAARQ